MTDRDPRVDDPSPPRAEPESPVPRPGGDESAPVPLVSRTVHVHKQEKPGHRGGQLFKDEN